MRHPLIPPPAAAPLRAVCQLGESRHGVRMSWLVEYRNGIYIPQINWWLDAHFPVERSFVSHAHFDHLATHQEILCSPGTARLTRARMGGERIEHILPFFQPERLTADTVITLFPAGHIFGSAQCLLEHPDYGSLLYTGDFKLRPGRSAELCATPHADTVIMETTYGLPRYVFPPTEKVVQDIINFCQQTLEDGEIPILFGYSLGKSQELLQGLTAAQLPVMLHPQTHRLTQVYEELGILFPPYRLFDLTGVAGHVVICPPQSNQSGWLRKIAPRRTAMITGWALDPAAIYRYQCDAAFPLSDHADFTDLIRFVDLVKPSRVLTLHGFSAQFAATLRERGIEAWAINQDNQLELGMPADLPVTEQTLSQRSLDPTRPALSNAFADFAATAEQVKRTTKKLEKIALLQLYFRSLDLESASQAVLFFTGRTFPQSESRALNVGWSVLKRAVLEVGEVSEPDFRAAYHRFADAGDAAEAVLASKPGKQRSDPTVTDIAHLFSELADIRGSLNKLGLLKKALSGFSPAETKYVVKIVTGDLRIGLKEGLVEEALAESTGQPLDRVREANLLCGNLSDVMAAAREDRLVSIQLAVFHPLQFMLASPEPTASAIAERLTPPIWIEEKYDGIRCQVHKRGKRAEMYSRDLHRISDQFGDLVSAAQELEGDFILDGELLAWKDNRALPFSELQKRLGRKGDDFFLGAEIPVSVSAYDLLWLNGQSLLKAPLWERRRLLEGLFEMQAAGSQERFHLAPIISVKNAVEIDAAFLASRQRGNEGLMAKDPNSFYTPGRRGLAWLKLKKAFATLDVVVVAVEYGHGKRRDVLSDYTFAIRDDATGQLLTVGKAYSGLTDKEIAEYTQHFLENTLEKKGRLLMVKPDTVLEVAFDSIQPSDRHQSGFALRFPRIARIRTDKTLAEIDTLETCRLLAAPPMAFSNVTP